MLATGFLVLNNKRHQSMNSKTAFKAILFDLDGTLLHTAPDLTVAINQLRAEYALNALPADEAIAMVGRGAINLVRRALREVIDPQTDFDIDGAYARFANYYHIVNGKNTVEFSGVTPTLQKLHTQGFRLGIVTNKPSEFTLPLIQQFGWEQLFDVVVCGDTTPYKKPNPAPIEFALNQLNVTAQEALMIGDSMNDAMAAVAAGCACHILTYGYNEGTPMREALAQQQLTHTPVFDEFASAVAV